ncbi:MAG: L-fucose isomerase [Bacteroidales bacterium]
MGGHPKIGIRPIIDGRLGGIRESLEEMTMQMAINVANFYHDNLRYSDGSPVECVIADSCIGGVAEAAKATEKFGRMDVKAVLSVTPCWCYGSETIDMDPVMPKAIWGYNKTERPGAVYLAAALAGHNQKGLPAFSIYGKDVQKMDDMSIPADVQESLLRFGRAAIAVTTMRNKSYLSIGSVSMGIAGSIVNADFFQDYLGMRNEYVDSCEVDRRISLEIFDKEEFERAIKWTRDNCKEGEDYNPPHLVYNHTEKDEIWKYVVKMTLVIRDLMIGNAKLKEMGFGEEAMGHNAIVSGFQGQRQWTDYKPNGDFSEAILNSSFDWNGLREAFLVATENDSLNGVSMLFGHLLTNTAQMFADVRTYWSPEAVEKETGLKLSGKAMNGIIHLINSGSCTLDGTGRQTKNGKPTMKPFWEISDGEVSKCLNAVTWYPGSREYFRGGGFSSCFTTQSEMEVTMFRLNLIKGEGPVLHIAEGWVVDVDPKIHDMINKRTDKTWPTTWFAPRLTGTGGFKDVYSVMARWGANHAAISYGHIGADLITLASMLRIPVCMHNVAEEKIFRPSVWPSFGMDNEGADYRACTNYGPLYR